MDLSKLSTEDLMALKSGDLTKVSTAGLQSLRGNAAPAASTQPSGLASAANGRSSFLGDMEALGSTITGAAAAPIAGISGMGNAILNAGARGINALTRPLGLPQIPQPTADAADQVRATQRFLQIQPQTQQGQNAVQGIGYLPGKLAQAGDAAGAKVADITGSPTLGAAANTALQSAPMLLGAGKLPSLPARAPAAIAPEVAEATGAGLKLAPEQAGGFLGKVVQSLSGSAKLERSLSKQNAPVVNNLAKQDIGISADQPLNASSIEKVKTPANAVYDQVGKLGQVQTDSQFARDIAGITNRTGSGSFDFDVPPAVDRLKTGYGGVKAFDAADAVAKVRQLRSDSSKNIKAQDPEQNALGYAQKQVANAIEEQLDRHVQQVSQTPGSGVPADLIDQFRGARQQLAKIHSVEDALDGQNISAKSLSKQLERGVPLSGNLRTIANAYNNFDRSLQDVSKIRNSGPFGVLDLGYGAAGGLAHPGMAAAVLARPLARAALASKAYQRYGIQGAPVNLSLPSQLPGGPLPGLLGTTLNQQQPQGLLR